MLTPSHIIDTEAHKIHVLSFTVHRQAFSAYAAIAFVRLNDTNATLLHDASSIHHHQ